MYPTYGMAFQQRHVNGLDNGDGRGSEHRLPTDYVEIFLFCRIYKIDERKAPYNKFGNTVKNVG